MHGTGEVQKRKFIMGKVLLVDDDVELCEMLAEYLAPEGFEVESAHDGKSGAQRAVEGGFDVVVLDVMLPRLNGFDALNRIRSSSQVPVLMLTARGDDLDRIVGLEMGADDYLPKPCNPRELVARLRAVLRRTQSTVTPKFSAPDSEVLRSGRLELRPGARLAMLGNQTLELTSTEYSLLEVLVRQAGKVVSKEQLSEQALGRDLVRYDRSIDVHVSNLRRKLGPETGEMPLIQTVRGVGYQLTTD